MKHGGYDSTEEWISNTKDFFDLYDIHDYGIWGQSTYQDLRKVFKELQEFSNQELDAASLRQGLLHYKTSMDILKYYRDECKKEELEELEREEAHG